MLKTLSLWAAKVKIKSPVSRSHNFTVRSREADAILFPDGEKLTNVTLSLCRPGSSLSAGILFTRLPLRRQILIHSSLPADAINWPSGLKFTLQTSAP